jgi:hypothetical protein
MVVFGVNKGLETEPEEKVVDGAELAEENYFEENGLTVRGEGTYTWTGTEALKKRNNERGRWEAVSLEEKELTTTISIEEEALGNGTKRIKWSFSDIIELVSEDEARVPYTRCGVVDKKTGLVYRARTYNLAESYVLEKDGEKFSILVCLESVEEEIGDGKIRSTVSYTLICPEDYNDAVLYLTCRDEIVDDNTYSNKEEVLPLHEFDDGKYELMFFRE